MRFSFLKFLILLFSLTINQNASFAAKPKVFIVAKIDNQIITNEDLIERYKFVIKLSRIRINSKTEKLLFLNQLLKKMIDEELQFNEAEKLGIKVNQEDLNAQIEKVASSQNKSLWQFKRFFRDRGLSYGDYSKQVASQILWSKIINKSISPKIKINQSEIEELIEFKKIKADSISISISEVYIPLDYQASNSKINSKSLADKLAKELQNGSDFSSIAKQFSRSPTSEFNGEIGWVQEGDIDNKVYQIIKNIEIGKITNPISIKGGYYIFKINDKKTVRNLNKEDINYIKNNIFNKKLQIAAKSHLMDLRKTSFIEINQDKLRLLVK